MVQEDQAKTRKKGLKNQDKNQELEAAVVGMLGSQMPYVLADEYFR
jgi:hypothetical protein